ncbi:hypothetical protein ACIXNO_16985 [Bacteroides fragilis]
MIKSIDESDFIERTNALNIFRPEFIVQKGKANVRKDIGVETIGDIVAHYPRLLAYFYGKSDIFNSKIIQTLNLILQKGM